MPSAKTLVTTVKWTPGIILVGAASYRAVYEGRTLLEHVPDRLSSWTTTALIVGIVGIVWTTVVIAVLRIGRGMNKARTQNGPFAALIGALIYSLITAPIVIVYLVSWNLFHQTGRFAGWEVINFAARNKYLLWQYLSDAEAANRELLVGCIILVGLVLPVIFLMSAVSASAEGEEKAKGVMARVWCGFAIAIMVGLISVFQGKSPILRSMQLGHLSTSTNPLVAMVTSIWESYSLHPIEAVLTAEELVDQHVEWTHPEEGPRPSIIVVAVESLRHDIVHLKHQGKEVTPNLNRLATAGLQWKRAYAQSTHSDYADVCIVSSLYPLRTRTHHFYGPNDPWPKTRIYDVLKPAGYATAIISSQNEAWGGMDAFLNSDNLDLFYHPEVAGEKELQIRPTMDPGFNQELEAGTLVAGKFPDFHTTDKAIEWIKEQTAEEKPFFLSMNFQSSHFPYLIPDSAKRPFTPHELDDEISFMSYPEEKTEQVRNAYYNALHESDRQLGRLVKALMKLKVLRNTILLVVGENGEAFHENGSVGHAREPVEPVIHVATVMFAPKYVTRGVEDYPLEHVDLMPTILGMMGWPPHPNFQGINALAEDRMAARERLLFFHVLSPAAKADAVLFGGRWKYVRNQRSQFDQLFDVVNDPGETTDIIDDQAKLADYLRSTLEKWRGRQLAYYHYPEYFTKSYPPQAPRWEPVKKEDVAEKTPAGDGES